MKNVLTVLRENIAVTASPSFVFRDAVVQEDLEKRVELRILQRNHGVQTEQGIEVKDGR